MAVGPAWKPLAAAGSTSSRPTPPPNWEQAVGADAALVIATLAIPRH